METLLVNKDRLLLWTYETYLDRGRYDGIVWGCFRKDLYPHRHEEGKTFYMYGFYFWKRGKRLKSYRATIETDTSAVARYLIRNMEIVERTFKKYNEKV